MTNEMAQLRDLIDREAIRGLVGRERGARDARDWGLMARSYTPDCKVAVTWFRGTAEEFVEASRRRISQTRSFHYVWPTDVDLNGDRALATSPMAINVRFMKDDTEIEVVSHARMVNRVVRTADGWRMASLDVLYRIDEARCIDPTRRLPVEWEEISAFRAAYRMMTWMVVSTGLPPDHELLGDDRPEELAQFLADARHWLACS